MRSIAHQQATMANHQVMMSPPLEVREKYFAEVYMTIQIETANRRMQEEVHQLQLLVKKKQLEEVISKSNTNERDDSLDGNEGTGDTNELDIKESMNNQSHWVQLALGRKEAQASELLNCSIGTEFTCLHNRDSHDFVNESKFK